MHLLRKVHQRVRPGRHFVPVRKDYPERTGNRKECRSRARDPQKEKGADFIDTTNNQKWDVKSPVSRPKGHTSPRKGAFNVDRMMANVKKEIARGNNVILDTRRLNKKDRQVFKDAIHNAGLDDNVIWYDKKGS